MGQGQGQGQDQAQGHEKVRQRSALLQLQMALSLVLALTLVLALVRNIIIFSKVRVLVLNQPIIVVVLLLLLMGGPGVACFGLWHCMKPTPGPTRGSTWKDTGKLREKYVKHMGKMGS